MNPTKNRILFWSGHGAMIGVSTLIVAWSVFPMGGATLPHHIEQMFQIAFTSSALLVSLLCGLMITCTMSFTLLYPETVEEGPGQSGSGVSKSMSENLQHRP